MKKKVLLLTVATLGGAGLLYMIWPELQRELKIWRM